MIRRMLLSGSENKHSCKERNNAVKKKKKESGKTKKKTAGKRKSPVKKAISPVMPPEGFVRLPVVLAVLGIGRSSFLLGVRDGRYPQPVKLGPRISAWRVEDIRAVIAQFAGK